MSTPARGTIEHRNSSAYKRARRQMFAAFGTVCHICGHDGAGEADHLVPIAVQPHQPVDPMLMRPAHGSSSPCPVCVGANGKPRKCNQERGVRPAPGPLRTSREW